MNDSTVAPRLLVSVRSVAEALAALAGGADIIDVKEPSRGSLGRADEGLICSIALVQPAQSGLSLSVALGEVCENVPPDALPLPQTTAFAKLGLAGLRNDREWPTRWLRIREAYAQRAVSPVGWIAVVYADADRAQFPPAEEIIHAAAATGCAGVLVDTFGKSGGRLLDYAAPGLLAEWSGAVRGQGMLFAAAGRLLPLDLSCLVDVAPDIIAVRSGVCVEGDRCAEVCPARVARFKVKLRDTWSPSPAASAIR